jgi:hypothetical protein
MKSPERIRAKRYEIAARDVAGPRYESVTQEFAVNGWCALDETQGTGDTRTPGDAVVPRAGRGETPRRSWYHFGTGCIVHYVQIVHDVDTSDDLDAHGHIYTPIRSAGG